MKTPKNMLINCGIPIVFFMASASHPLCAQEGDDLFDMSIEELLNVQIAVASQRPETILNSPSTVSVVSRETIEQYNFQTVAEAINSVAGMSIVKTGSRTEIPTGRWILSDHYPNKILVMIDGVPTWESNTGATTLGHLNPGDIKQIEI